MPEKRARTILGQDCTSPKGSWYVFSELLASIWWNGVEMPGEDMPHDVLRAFGKRCRRCGDSDGCRCTYLVSIRGCAGSKNGAFYELGPRVRKFRVFGRSGRRTGASEKLLWRIGVWACISFSEGKLDLIDLRHLRYTTHYVPEDE